MIGVRAYPTVGIFGSLAAGVGVDEIGSGTVPATTTLSVALTDSADPVITAVAFSYAFVVTNTGGITATSVTASVALDASLTYGSASGTGWTVDASALPTVTFTRASGSVGALPTITINVTSGGSATTASSTANASASNASAATPSTQTTAVKLVSKDATSGIRVPASSTEWTDFIAYAALGISAPSSLWLCQEASGTLADSIGSLTLSTAGATITYQSAVSGWSRLGLGFNDAGNGRFTVGSGVGPSPTTTSQTWVCFASATAAGGTRDIVGCGSTGATDIATRLVATGVYQNLCVNVPVSGTDTSTFTAGVLPIVLKYDRTAGASMSYTGKEKITGTYSALTVDGAKGLGAAHGSTPAMQLVYAMLFTGSAAEMTDATVKALLAAMGFAIPWS